MKYVSFFVKQTCIFMSKYAVATAKKTLKAVNYRQEKSLYFGVFLEIQALWFWQGQKDLNPLTMFFEFEILYVELHSKIMILILKNEIKLVKNICKFGSIQAWKYCGKFVLFIAENGYISAKTRFY